MSLVPTITSRIIESRVFESIVNRFWRKTITQYNYLDGWNFVLFFGSTRKIVAARAKHVECCFMFGLVWSVGSTGVEAGQKAFLEFLDNVITDPGVIAAEWEGVNNALQVSVR